MKMLLFASQVMKDHGSSLFMLLELLLCQSQLPLWWIGKLNSLRHHKADVVQVYDNYYSFGRKKTLLVGAVPLLVGWILVGVSKSISLIYVSRVLCGFSYGLSYSVLPMYLAEISSDKIRGSITIILTVMAKCGILYSYLIGNYNSLHTAAWIGKFILMRKIGKSR